MGSDHSTRPRETAAVGAPRPQTASTRAWRSMAWEMARRTRTSVKGGISVRMLITPPRLRQEILVHQVGVTLLERLQVLLAYGPIDPRATVDLAGAVHCQTCRFVRDD